MFIQVHTLTSYHATLLNRDDAGLAKRIPFGNATRLRVSSQCLKRHWREALKQHLDLSYGMRTRFFFKREVLRRLVEEQNVDETLANDLVRQLARAIIKSAGEGKEPLDDNLQMKQPVLFGLPEANYFVDLIVECAKEGKPAEELQNRLNENKKNFTAMLKSAGYGDLFAGVEGALFGRFVTSDILSRSDASIHAAHSFTVHALDTEIDYFTVLDDLAMSEETGAAHAGDMELGAGVFYGYVVIDIPQLMSNFTGCKREDWRKQDETDVKNVIRDLIKSIATVSPGAKLGATAPHAYSDFLMLETGTQQPRSLANAFIKAIPMTHDVMQSSIDEVNKYLKKLDGMYGQTVDARFIATTKEYTGEEATIGTLENTVRATLDGVFKE